MEYLQEKLWFSEWKVAQSRAKPGKALRRAYSEATDGQVQDLAGYFAAGNSVEVSNSTQTWVDAYEGIRSCMQGKGALCQRAYTPHGVSIAVLRSSAGAILALALVRRLESGKYVAFRGYGSMSHQLMAVLEFLGEVQLTADWMSDVEEVSATGEMVIVGSGLVYIYKTVATGSWPYFSHKYVDCYHLYRRVRESFRPYVDGGLAV